MSTHNLKRGAGAALALALCSTAAFPALAQTSGSAQPNLPSGGSSETTASTSTSIEQRTILTRLRRDGTYEAARPFTREDDNNVLTLDQWRSRRQNAGRPLAEVDAEFESIALANQKACTRAASFTDRLHNLAGKYKQNDATYASLYERTSALKGKRQTGSWLRRGGIVGSIIAGFSVSTPYGWVVAPAMLGNEAAATGNDRAQDVNRQHALANIEHSRNNIEHSLITIEMDLLWVEMTADWCVSMDMWEVQNRGFLTTTSSVTHTYTPPAKPATGPAPTRSGLSYH